MIPTRTPRTSISHMHWAKESHNLSACSNKTQQQNLTKSFECEMQVKGTGSLCVLVEYVKENYYARFHGPSYHLYRESRFSILPDVKF